MLIAILSISQIVLVIMLVVLVLLQPSDSNALSGFSNTQQQGFNSIIPVKSSVSPLSKVTTIFAGLFIVNTLLLSGLYSKDVRKKSIAEKIELETEQENKPISVPFED
ncbi:MAG: preprotein translocase subunit SecG [Wolbachia endosymbiont of Fragariocoptes setiger]|nr:preprotein translocase subunit SecG [Wolbachia endosymbiont of Fragariocoptes setiger]